MAYALCALHHQLLELIQSPPLIADAVAINTIQQEAGLLLVMGMELFYPTQVSVLDRSIFSFHDLALMVDAGFLHAGAPLSAPVGVGEPCVCSGHQRGRVALCGAQ